jgi:predicted GNAT family N-acyltransferase
MKLQDFHVEVANWANAEQQAALREVRHEVFVVGQNVPEAREQDGLDAACWHVLARDAAGQALGCARLRADHKIERMAVRAAWRGRGVGAALLRELIARARTQGQEEVMLAAQVSALGFYQHAGFVAYGAEFTDAGMAHRMMRLPIAVQRADPTPLRDIGALAAGNRGDVAIARLQLLADARHQLSIYVPALDSDMYAGVDELAELRRIAVSGRAASIRILLHDPVAALRDDHPLIPLAQRLPSAFQIRTPLEAVDLTYASAYLLNDAGGYLFLPNASRPAGRAARDHRAAQVPLRQYFNEVWERAERATILNTLDL